MALRPYREPALDARRPVAEISGGPAVDRPSPPQNFSVERRRVPDPGGGGRGRAWRAGSSAAAPVSNSPAASRRRAWPRRHRAGGRARRRPLSAPTRRSSSPTRWCRAVLSVCSRASVAAVASARTCRQRAIRHRGEQTRCGRRPVRGPAADRDRPGANLAAYVRLQARRQAWGHAERPSPGDAGAGGPPRHATARNWSREMPSSESCRLSARPRFGTGWADSARPTTSERSPPARPHPKGPARRPETAGAPARPSRESAPAARLEGAEAHGVEVGRAEAQV